MNHPLPMSLASERAYRAGCKTQTRRLVKPQPPKGYFYFDTMRRVIGVHWWISRRSAYDPWRLECPYGQPGDLLWLRVRLVDQGGFVAYQSDGEYLFANTDPTDTTEDGRPLPTPTPWPWKKDTLASIYMPRWACRDIAELVSVRVERLQEISFSDCEAEGTQRTKYWKECRYADEAYAQWWNSLHPGPDENWSANPWVWVLEFRRLTGDELAEALEELRGE